MPSNSRLLDVCNNLKSLARQSNMSYKLAAAVLKRSRVVGSQNNTSVRSCIRGKCFPAVHAEIGAVFDLMPKLRTAKHFHNWHFQGGGNQRKQ
jgi:hypothetical protein